MNITHVIVHTPEQVREIVQEAREIAADYAGDDTWEARVFEEACKLLGQRATIAAPQQPVDLGAFKLAEGWR